MSLTGFYTTKGIALAAKLLAGTTLTITKVVAGDGETASSYEALAGIKQTLTVGTATVKEQTATLPVTLAEVNAATSYSLSELGVYAEDPDEGEILYQVFRMDRVQHITAGGNDTYRFYIQEIVGAGGITVTCSPAGLLTDADIAPLRGKILTDAVPERTVTLAAADLQNFLDGLPKLINETLYLNISGTVTETIKLKNFYGNGLIYFNGQNNTVLEKGISVSCCSISISISRCTIYPAAEGDKCCVYIQESPGYTYVELSTLTGNGSSVAIEAREGSIACVCNCTMTNHSTCVFSSYSSVISILLSSSSYVSGNQIGAYPYRCGIILLGESTPSLLGGSANSHNGGLIVATNGSVL